MNEQQRSQRYPSKRSVRLLTLAGLCWLVVGSSLASSTSVASTGPTCRLQGSGTIATGDSVHGSGHTTGFVANLGTGHLSHTTSTGERFRSEIEILSCHANTGDIADVESFGHFQGSGAVLSLLAQIEDRTPLGEPDYYTVGIFNGETLVYSTAGVVVDGDFEVTITP